MRTNSSNDEQHFQRIVKRFYRPVTRFFANRGFPRDDIQDLTQDTFLSVYRSLEGFRGESSEATWLFKIAANTWRNALRSRSAKKHAAEEIGLDELFETSLEPTSESGTDTTTDPLKEALIEERTRLLREAIDELPSQMRHCVFLRVTQDMKYREIAAVTQVSIQTVRSQLHDARKQLKKRLGEYFDELE